MGRLRAGSIRSTARVLTCLDVCEPLGQGLDAQTESRGVPNLLGFVERAARADLEWASMSPRAFGFRSANHPGLKVPAQKKWSTGKPVSLRNLGISPHSMDQSSATQSERQGRRLQTLQLSAPSLLSTKSLYPTDSLPTITTLDASSGRYPTRSSIPSVQKSAPSNEDELHSEPESQQANTRQESGEGGTTSDFVKKLYRFVSGSQPEMSRA